MSLAPCIATAHRRGSVSIVTLVGTLDSRSAVTLEVDLKAAFEDAKSVVFDLTNVTYVSSAGWQVLLVVSKKFRQQDGTMHVVGMQESVRDVFELLGLGVLICAHQSIEAAMQVCETARLAPVRPRGKGSGNAS
jgi:anti-sigma B factor antagonist